MNTEVMQYQGSESRELAHPNETAGSAAAAQAKALVEARYIMALRRPRNEEEVRQKLLKECQRPSFAGVAIYRKPIGQGIEGPSIRFAEAALRMMGNITIDTMTVYDDREKRIVRVTVTDLEANLPYAQDVTIEKTVERRQAKKGDDILRTRQNKQGDTVYIIAATDDEILNKQNALLSKAIRTQGLRLVPGDLIDEALYIVRQTRQKEDAQDPDAAKRRLFDAFNEQGVSAADLAKWLGHPGEKLTEKERSDLRGIYAALRDGETSWREVMDAKTGGTDETLRKASGLKDALDQTKAKSDDASLATFDSVKVSMQSATSSDELDMAWSDKDLIKDLKPKQEQELATLYAQREAELRK
jgi:hypothetical protein